MTKKHKSASTKSRQAAPAAPSVATAETATTASPELARIHHLSSCAVLALPPELRVILGEEGYARCLKEFKGQALEFLIHIDGDVIYLNSQLTPMSQQPLCASEVKAADRPEG